MAESGSIREWGRGGGVIGGRTVCTITRSYTTAVRSYTKRPPEIAEWTHATQALSLKSLQCPARVATRAS